MVGREVKVARLGNSRALPLPADVARQQRAEVGTTWRISPRGRSIVYSPIDRAGDRLPLEGEGPDRVGVLSDADLAVADDEEGTIGYHTWDEV